jgi:phage/plasmid-associated DNA primase
MKIVMGKFSSEPFHALSKKEVSLLLKIVPQEWVEQLSSVVLSSKIFKKTKLVKPVEYTTTTKQLTIYSRGLVRDDIARQLLYEIALIGAQAEETQSDQVCDLNTVIKPYMDKFLKTRF